MKFRRMLKRKVYPTWVSTRKLKGCSAYVFEVHRENRSFYHYQIVCDSDIQYASLVDSVKYNTLEECCNATETWIRNNL